jgi:membrane protein DedA with SNARE-associated domain
VRAEFLLYAALFLTVIWQEEAAPLAGALAAHHGHADLWLVWAACTLGTWVGDVTLWAVGRRGKKVLARPGVARALALVREHPRAAPLAVRFAYGMRLTLPIACGAAGVGLPGFVLWAGLSAVAWAGLFTLLGWTVGEAAVRLFREAEHYELPAVIAVFAIGAALYALHWLRRRARSHVQAPAPASDG